MMFRDFIIPFISISLSNKKKMKNALFIVFIIFILFTVRLAYIQFVWGAELSEKAWEQQSQSRSITAKRGTIYDSTGKYILAENSSVESISINPTNIPQEIKDKVAHALCDIFELDYEKISKKVHKRSSIESIVKKVDKSKADELRNWMDTNGITTGINIDGDSKRYYPYGSLLSKVMGFAGSDNQGVLGLEVTYDDVLKGINGSVNEVTDAKGNELSESPETITESIPGNNLVTTIDINIQKYAERTADKILEEKNAKRVSIIVMNPKNGEIYAMVDAPEYDLNNPYEYIGNDAITSENETELLNRMWRNYLISDTYEPGSICKIITASAAIEKGVVSDSDMFYCPGYRIVEDRRIRCHKTTGHGSETFEQALMNSCNPAFMDIGSRVGAEYMLTYYEQLGLYSKTGIDLPGEGNSIMHKLQDIGEVELATMSFGQSFQITPIQFVTAIATVINGGSRITPHIGMEITDNCGNIVMDCQYKAENGIISPETSEKMRQMLEKVVSEGGGNKAYIEGYRIGGKTATSEKFPRGTGKYIASFMGFAPADDPQVMAMILIDEPEGAYYGGVIAAPVIKDLFLNILPYLNIPAVQ